MIAYLHGTILSKQADRVVLDVNGVGYEVMISDSTHRHLGPPGKEAALHVYAHIRENMFALFGFHDPQDKRLFEKFLEVRGVGPRLALALLSGLSTPELLAAIRGGAPKRLVGIPGVGKRTGERIVLELKGKLKEFEVPEGAVGSEPAGLEADVISALINLGSTPEVARRSVRAALKKDATTDFETLFRTAMESIGR